MGTKADRRFRRLTSIPILGLLAGLSGCLGPGNASEGAPSPPDDVVCTGLLAGIDLREALLAELQEALSAGKFTSVELVQSYVARIDALDTVNPALNSIRAVNPAALEQAVRLDAERAAGLVRGPLHGLTIVLKDNVGTNDMPTTAGSIALALNVPPADSTVVGRLREAGVIILGKANLNEFSNWMSTRMPMGYSSLGGQVVNAYTGGSPGGSSAGSGVAGSMAFASAAIGTDTTGSVTYPSNMNSLAGLRPTHALVSHAGIIPIIPHFDVAGPMARHVTDVALVLGAIVGPDPLDPFSTSSAGHVPPKGDYVSGLSVDGLRGARLGYEADAGSPDFARVRQKLAELGAVLVQIQADSGTLSQAATAQIAGLAANEFKFSINHYLAHEAGPGLPVRTLADIIAYNERHPDKVKYGQDFLVLSEATPGRRELTDAGYAAVVQNSRALADAMFRANDLDAMIGLARGITPFSAFTAAAGYPNMVVPAGYDGATPYGLNFFGPAWSEPQLLNFAYAYEQATMIRRPPELINAGLLEERCGSPASLAAPETSPPILP